MIKCHKCGWEGTEQELIEKPGNLYFYDRLAKDTFKMNVTRSDYHCPNCGEKLRSHRLINGMVFDK